ncbi:PAS domain-containing protein [Sphingomonas adhaesiva]|uniref:PAS domain-containing protein n=1 Tax=Sphingomonas adhaesiva TaxID=28212 RepID=UPI0035C6AEC1
MNDGDPNDLAAMFWRDALEEPANASMLDEASCRQLADNIPTLCWIADGDGYITWYNRRWYDYTGTTPEQMKGWGWQSVHDPEVLPAVMERWTAAIGTGKAFEIVRRQNIRHNSRRKLAECGPRLGVDVMRRACGVASVDIRWSVV